MKIHRFVLTVLAPAAFSLAMAGDAAAEGACVFVKQEALQCVEASSVSSCSAKSPSGEFHSGTTCKNIGYGVTWGMAKPPAPPAKGSFDGSQPQVDRMSHRTGSMPKIESPIR